MKVNPKDLQAYGRTAATGVQGTAKAREVGKDAKAQAPRGDGAAAHVSISAEARKLAETQGANPPASSPKVAALKEQVQSGSYKVDSQVVARKMIDEIG